MDVLSTPLKVVDWRYSEKVLRLLAFEEATARDRLCLVADEEGELSWREWYWLRYVPEKAA